MKGIVAITTTVAYFLMAGCGIVPSSKTSTLDSRAAGAATTQHETTLRRATEGVLPANVAITIGKGGTVNYVPAAASVPFKEQLEVDDDGGQSSESSMSWAKLDKNVIPWGIRLCLAALGILLLIWVVKYLRRASPAVDAVLRVADDGIAARVARYQERAIASTDPGEIARMTANIASLQSERLELLKAKKK